MSIIKNVIKHNLVGIDDPKFTITSDAAELQQYYRDEIDWQQVEQEVLKEVNNHVDTSTLEASKVHDIITKQLEIAKHSVWFLNVVKQAQVESSEVQNM